MNTHLSEDVISRLIIGNGSSDEQQHVDQCSQCSGELERLKQTLSVFRHSVEHWAEQNGGAVVPESPFLRTASPAFRIRPLTWVLAAALAVLVAIPIYRNVSEQQREAKSFEDTLLLEQVNAQLSRVVPEPMEPLMHLVTDSAAEETGGRQ
jgi:hypothetical protein